MVKNPPASSGDGGREDPLEKKRATHSSILDWRIPRTEEPHELLSTGSQRVRHDLVSKEQYTIEKNSEMCNSRIYFGALKNLMLFI